MEKIKGVRVHNRREKVGNKQIAKSFYSKSYIYI